NLLQADCNFIEELYRMSAQWKFLTCPGGMGFPIKCNLEILFKGENKLKTEISSSNKEERWKNDYAIVNRKLMNTRSVEM
ncbi:hypothetical protein A6R68_00003, partial [Neotoma lepida]